MQTGIRLYTYWLDVHKKTPGAKIKEDFEEGMAPGDLTLHGVSVQCQIGHVLI